eukprot:g6850.t1
MRSSSALRLLLAIGLCLVTAGEEADADSAAALFDTRDGIADALADQLRMLKEGFADWDKDSSGALDHSELRARLLAVHEARAAGFKAHGQEQARKMFKFLKSRVDADRNGKLSLDEVLQARSIKVTDKQAIELYFLNIQGPSATPEEIARAVGDLRFNFEFADANGNKALDNVAELEDLMDPYSSERKEEYRARFSRRQLEQLDTDGNGSLSFEEWLRANSVPENKISKGMDMTQQPHHSLNEQFEALDK